MFITKECDYAIRVVRGLADGEIKSVKSVCEKEDIPHSFAYKILKKMEREGIVAAFRGNTGGYQLVKSLDKLTLFDIVQAVDKRLYINECLEEGHDCTRNGINERCMVHQEFIRIQRVLDESLQEKTMLEIVSDITET